jgi:hypothetical protein
MMMKRGRTCLTPLFLSVSAETSNNASGARISHPLKDANIKLLDAHLVTGGTSERISDAIQS